MATLAGFFDSSSLRRGLSGAVSVVLLAVACALTAIPAKAICNSFTVSESSLDFGLIVPGQISSMTLIVTPGGFPNNFSLSIQDQNPAPAFTVAPTSRNNAENPFSVKVTFQPNSASGTGWSADLVINGCGTSETVSLNGGNFGGSPSVDVTDLEFGTVAVGQTMSQQFNVGASTDPAAPLKITITTSSPVVSANPKTFQVDQNSSRQVTVNYTPVGGIGLNERVVVKAVFASTNFPVPNDLTVDVSGGGFGITTFRLPNGAVGSPYSAPIEATGGSKPYIWTVATGSLPEGLTLNPSSGVVSGTPVKAEKPDFALKATEGQGVSHTKNLSITVSGGAPPPAIDTGGAVLSTGTPKVEQASATAIISVFGKEFAPEGTSALQPALDETGKVATQLASTCLEINNVRAPMFAVVPTQVNAQVPSADLVGPGTASVVVVRNCGTVDELRSSAENLIVTQNAPAFFNFVNNASGVNPIAAVDLGGVLVGEPNLIPGGQFAPAEPGEFISLYGTGFGLTEPPVQAGAIPMNVVPNGVSSVVGQASLTIGGIAVVGEDLAYVGLAPCCAGLNQVVAKVPVNAPDGNLPAVLTINGVSSAQGPYITVRKP